MGGLAQGPMWPGRNKAGGQACAAAQDLEQHAAQDVNAHCRGRHLGSVARGERAEGRAAHRAAKRHSSTRLVCSARVPWAVPTESGVKVDLSGKLVWMKAL